MPAPAVVGMEGAPVRLDAGLAQIRPSWWDVLWSRLLGGAVIPERPSGKVTL